MSAPHFWQNKEKAEKITQEFSQVKEELKVWTQIKKELDKLETAQELLTDEKDPQILKEAKKHLYKLEKQLHDLFLRTLLSGKYDRRNCLLSIYAGAGGLDAQDWADMLSRMYLRYCENKKWPTRILDQSRGTEAGIKSITLEVKGPYAYGFLKEEAGVHRLIRLSPFDADNARHTSFALVEVLPDIPAQEVKIREEDLKIETFRSSGAGGQSVNKTSSAVRIKHLPTKITVQCQNERSQQQNKLSALKILRGKLEQLAYLKKTEEKLKARGEHTSPQWANQIRSYFLHPYKLVKDHRTKFEMKNVEKVLDGEIERFILAALKKGN